MPAKRLTMRKIRKVLRLKFDCKLTNRKIAKSCCIARSTVGEYIRRFSGSSLTWPLPDDLDDSRLEQVLFPPVAVIPAHERPLPDWSYTRSDVKEALRISKLSRSRFYELIKQYNITIPS